jgi:predicted HTH domain antitoxin
MRTIRLTKPLDEHLAALVERERPLDEATREALVMELFRRGRVSTERASQFLEIDSDAFVRLAAERGLHPFPDDVRRGALQELNRLLHNLGDANDAQDHGDARSAEALREEAHAGVRGLLDAHPFLSARFPDLRRRLETGTLEGVGWSRISDAIERDLAQK